MPEKTVTIFVNDDGTIDLQKFADDSDLSKVKQLVDGLRGSNEELKATAAKARELEKLGATPEQVATWKKDAEQAQALRDQIAQLEGKASMTDDEKRKLEELQSKVEAFGDLDPEKAKAALDFQARTVKEQQLAEAFEAAGLNPKAALRLDGIRSLDTRVQSEQKDGKTVKTAQVKVGDEWRPLTAHVESEYSDFLPVLKPSDDKKQAGPAPIDGVRPRAGKGGDAESLAGAIQQHYSKT